MKNSTPTQQRLLEINIVQKLKISRGINFVKKLVNFVQLRELAQQQTISNDNSETYLVFNVQGTIEISRRKRGQLEVQTLKQNFYCLVDKNVQKLTAIQNSLIYVLPQRYIIQIFEGVISLPFMNIRLNELRKNSIFQSMEKRKLVKIAFDLQQLHYKIGTKIFSQEHGPHQTNHFCFYIISGELKLVRNNVAVCMIGPTEIFGCLNQEKLIDNGCSVGHIITESAHLYKIPANLVFDNSNNAIQFVSKRTKWRQIRLTNIRQSMSMQKQQKKGYVKQGTKQSILQIIYKNGIGIYKF